MKPFEQIKDKTRFKDWNKQDFHNYVELLEEHYESQLAILEKFAKEAQSAITTDIEEVFNLSSIKLKQSPIWRQVEELLKEK